ncbi:PepSY domain-containing protein [[Pseudomonas] boreopolis]|uniref:PepSY domain-containing protein n=1 Tax=Xanthomonas boreopolis TaxID=86183 RepID=UPI003D490DD5
MIKSLLFQLHWLLGISAGAVLALMGLTGALLAFEDEALHALNPAQAAISERHARGETPLPLPELLRRLQVGPEQRLARLIVDPTGDRLSRLRAQQGPGQRLEFYFDPYTGQRLDDLRGVDAFQFIEELHRHLAAGERGKAVTGACAFILLFFCLSGLYLRWPRQWWNWRAWAVVEWRRQGRGFLWSLHSVIGTWCLLLYVVIALTGLNWSYDWYRKGLVRVFGDTPAAAAGRGARPGDGERKPWNLERMQAALDGVPGLARDLYDLRFPERGTQVAVRYRPADPAHSRAYDLVEIDGIRGLVLRRQPYAGQSAGEQLLTSLYALHTGSFFGLPGRIAWMLAAACMPLFFVTGWLLYLDRRRKKRALREARQALVPAAPAGEPWLVGFASQSGFAERLAWHAAGQLQAAGLPAQVRPLAQLDPATLGAARRALFVVSTFGDGEAPDAARGVEKRLLRQAQALPELGYALLALGDRQYARFCGFSRRLEAWLTAQGARALFPTVEVDNADPQALAHWQAQLAGVTGTAVASFESHRPAYASWRLRERRWLNPGSEGGQTWRIDLEPPAGTYWRAGDILEIEPQQAPDVVRECLRAWRLEPGTPVQVDGRTLALAEAAALRALPPPAPEAALPEPQAWLDALAPLGTREYSVASVAEDGVLQLVVRLMHDEAGRPGLGSGWLALHAPLGGEVRARVRANPGFRRSPGVPMVLIGNGTGIAGLRSLLVEAQRAGEPGHWLLFGERNAAHDRLFGEELDAWLALGHLQRLDLAFSRDQAHKVYVQDRLRERAGELRAWLARGAVIHVCGSLQGMAQAVDAELRRQLGEDGLDALVAEGRYRRDVY